MPRLVVHPRTPLAWEIQLKPGANYLGRAFANDFKIEDPSVSSSHCEITVNDGLVTVKDLGSTNGTFLNRTPVQETLLHPGQTLHLGAVELLFDSDAAPSVALGVAQPPVAPTISIAPRATMPSPSRTPPPPVTYRPAAEPVATVSEAESDVAVPPPIEAAPSVAGEQTRCKYHPKTPSRWLCSKCHRAFCDLCVTSRPSGGRTVKTCRTCGIECSPVAVNLGSLRKNRPTFFKSLPGTVIYPFRGAGVLILICATILFAALEMMGGIFSILLTMAAIGYLFSYMQNIIHTTAADETEALSLPGADELFGACFRLVGTVLLSFGLAIGFIVARMLDVPVPAIAIIVTVLFGCLYFPMAILAVAMKDSIMAANPLIVLPAIFKMPLEYLVTAVLLMGVFGVRQFGNIMSGVAGSVSFSTNNMSVLFLALGFKAIWSFISVYLLTVNMRILGMLYVTKKEKFGWFSH